MLRLMKASQWSHSSLLKTKLLYKTHTMLRTSEKWLTITKAAAYHITKDMTVAEAWPAGCPHKLETQPDGTGCCNF